MGYYMVLDYIAYQGFLVDHMGLGSHTLVVVARTWVLGYRTSQGEEVGCRTQGWDKMGIEGTHKAEEVDNILAAGSLHILHKGSLHIRMQAGHTHTEAVVVAEPSWPWRYRASF